MSELRFARQKFGLSTKGEGEHFYCPRRATKGHEGPRRATKGHEGPRRATKGHEENLCKVIVWSAREGPRREPLFCPRRAAKGHEENLCKVIVWSAREGPRREPLFCPRRAAKGHEENLCKVIIWSAREGRGRKPFLSTKGHGGPRRKPLQGHKLVCPRRAEERGRPAIRVGCSRVWGIAGGVKKCLPIGQEVRFLGRAHFRQGDFVQGQEGPGAGEYRGRRLQRLRRAG